MFDLHEHSLVAWTARRNVIVPDLLQRRYLVRYLWVWSAGCATGEEPYSLVIALREALPTDPPWQINILATDINRRFLERAREAVYGNWSFRETPPAVRDRYFIPENGRWRLRDEVKHDVIFAQLNLVEPTYPSPQLGIIAFDLIFCRNVLIYFDDRTMQQIVQRLYDALTPGGWLVVGHAETHIERFRQFETYNAPGTVLYRKPLQAPPFVMPSTNLPALPLPPPPSPPVLAVQPPTPMPAPAPTSAPTPSPEERLRQARAAADHGDWDAAQAYVQQVLEINPLYAPAYYLLAQIAEHHGRLEEALADYRRSLYLDSHFVMGLIGMAGVAMRLNQMDTVRRSLRQAQQLLEQCANDTVVDPLSGGTAGDLRSYIALLWQQVNR
ncbi:MCP methyltransferase, CheR-type with Tpr repeats [Chloroflexus aggregans DSM 9485]|uniref:MCP methyltransferase, CheR-type with Tpr repeats n=1 Tax=Chloroflexus aggregans (strain MD-66 / DSM 9485) TaxID=326427 RepID=B8G4P4_CHLAD|nr:MCP methyltransferase, CheR-type with Tpr repeats [Chloroflexus aggregans DSM 9485]